MVRSPDHKSIYNEQVKHLYRLCSIGIAATLVNSFLLVFILRNVISHTALINWLSAMLLVALFQYILQQIYISTGVMSDEPNRWGTWFNIGAALSGLFWGSTAIFLFPTASIIDQLYLALLSFGMLAVAVGAYGVIMDAFLAYCIPAILPMIIRFFLIEDEIHFTLGAIMLIVSLLMVFAVKGVNSSMKTLIRLRLHDFDPISPLEERNGVSERLNQRIKGEKVFGRENEGEREKLRTAQWMREFEQAKRKLNTHREEDGPKVQKNEPSRPDKWLSRGPLLQVVIRDINNLLTYIQGKASLMLLDMDADHPGYDRLKGIEKSVQRGSDLTKKLSELGKGLEPEIETTNLNDLIEKHFHELRGKKDRIACHLKYQDEIWDVKAGQEETERMIKKIYEDSCRSMPDGGELYIRTQNITLGDAYARPHGLAPGKFVKVSITDTGPAPEARGPGGSAGEAAWVHDFIKKSGGILQVHREDGNVTTVDLYLPACENGFDRQKRLKKNE